MGYQFGVGDYVCINRPKYLFNGQYYRIVQLTKTKLQASFQLDKPKQTVEKTLAELRNWEKNGIYLPGCTSWSINLQNLVGLYHLTEGTGTVAKDSSPVETPANGAIVNGHWDNSPIGGGAKVLALSRVTVTLIATLQFTYPLTEAALALAAGLAQLTLTTS